MFTSRNIYHRRSPILGVERIVLWSQNFFRYRTGKFSSAAPTTGDCVADSSRVVLLLVRRTPTIIAVLGGGGKGSGVGIGHVLLSV
jgi:hypothetical protein